FSSAGRAPCSQVDGAGDQERANEPRRLRWFFTRHFGAPASSPVSQRRISMEKQPALSRPDICPKSRQYPTAHPEVELKLLASPAAIERIRQAPVIKRHARNRGVVRRLDTVYYDTPDRALSRQRSTLRVRRNGGRYVQTLKLAHPGAAPF